MSKTLEEMAEEYRKAWGDEQLYKIRHEHKRFEWGDALIAGFLAGYDAGYATGYNAGYTAGFDGCLKIQEATTEHLEKQMVEEMYVRMEPLLKEEK